MLTSNEISMEMISQQFKGKDLDQYLTPRQHGPKQKLNMWTYLNPLLCSFTDVLQNATPSSPVKLHTKIPTVQHLLKIGKKLNVESQWQGTHEKGRKDWSKEKMRLVQCGKKKIAPEDRVLNTYDVCWNLTSRRNRNIKVRCFKKWDPI